MPQKQDRPIYVSLWLFCFPDGASGKESTRVQSLGGEDPLEEGMATHSSIPA